MRKMFQTHILSYKFGNGRQPQLTLIMHSADYNAQSHVFLLTT